MRRFDKKNNLQTANILFEQRHLKEKGLIKEDGNVQEMNPGLYRSRVIEKLIDLDSGQKVIDRLQSGRYDELIKRNMERGFTSDKTAMSIRDHWYGVDEGINELSPNTRINAAAAATDAGRIAQAGRMRVNAIDLNIRDRDLGNQKKQEELDAKVSQYYSKPVNLYSNEGMLTNSTSVSRVMVDSSSLYTINLVAQGGGIVAEIKYSPGDDKIKIITNNGHGFLDRQGAMVIANICKRLNPESKLQPQSGNMGQIIGIHIEAR